MTQLTKLPSNKIHLLKISALDGVSSLKILFQHFSSGIPHSAGEYQFTFISLSLSIYIYISKYFFLQKKIAQIRKLVCHDASLVNLDF